MKLIIVESPTKAKTISRFLGDDFQVESSYGHVRDLPKSKLGVDVENNFTPSYIIPIKAKKKVGELKKIAKKADEIILASDEDREGEAIAWHLTWALDIESHKNVKRIVFHEITKSAIVEALKSPRVINMDMVDAQQARRVLDRLVGYELSPFLWKKIYRGLSAGRVQSVAVRLIVEREKEISVFKSNEYWTITTLLLGIKNNKSRIKNNEFEAKLIKKNEKLLDKFFIKNKGEADKIMTELKDAKYVVEKMTKKEMRRQPPPPFTTSTLQQTVANKLGYSAKQTMIVAQKLYEKGFITYMRTDSVNLSQESLVMAKKVIEKNFGEKFALETPRRFKTKSKTAQEAHEAVRPTNPAKIPEDLKTKFEPSHYKLYSLIWNRFIASQMKEALFDLTTIDVATEVYTFRASGSILKFAGWLKIYGIDYKDENILPNLNEKDDLKLIKITPDQHFTEPPPRYSEATLVKALEEHGIGRPSTYAPTISTIQNRQYVEKNDQKRFVPTETGATVNDILVKHFPKIVDVDFTAKMEEDLDKIAIGESKWKPIIKDFYEPFHKNLEKKYKEVAEKPPEETNEKCEKCGKRMIIKHGRFGKFIACSGFPECKNTKTVPPKAVDGLKCPRCKAGDVIIKKTKKQKIFYGCSKYPECEFATWQKPTGELCIECSEPLIALKSGIKCSNKNCKFKSARKTK